MPQKENFYELCGNALDICEYLTQVEQSKCDIHGFGISSGLEKKFVSDISHDKVRLYCNNYWKISD